MNSIKEVKVYLWDMVATLCTVLQGTVNISGICSKLPVRNQLCIAAIVGDLVTEYFIICEQKVFYKVSEFEDGTVYSVFVLLLFQLGIPRSCKMDICLSSRLHFRAT